MENKELVQIKESNLAKMTKEEVDELKAEIKESGLELEVIQDLTGDIDDITNDSLTYFCEPIILDEEEILKNENFKKGLENGYKLGGILTAMVNSGFSRELAENYAVESAMFEIKLEIAKLEQNNKNLENEFNAI